MFMFEKAVSRNRSYWLWIACLLCVIAAGLVQLSAPVG